MHDYSSRITLMNGPQSSNNNDASAVGLEQILYSLLMNGQIRSTQRSIAQLVSNSMF